MANVVSAFYQTLVEAASEASAVLVGTNSMLDSVYLDYKPVESSPGIGQTVNIAIPASVTASIADGGTADPVITDISFSTKSIAYNKHPSFTYVVRDFEQFNSPADVRKVFLDGVLKGILENIDNTLCSLVTTANFTTNTAIVATGNAGKYPATSDFNTALGVLAGQKVDTLDVENMTFLHHPTIFYRQNTDANWTQESIAGIDIADQVRMGGALKVSYGSKIKFDQQMPTTGVTPTRTFYSLAFHRYALALVSRPLPKPDGNVVDYMYMNLKGVPVRIQVGYSILKRGYVVDVDAGYGAAVVRENMGQIITSSE